MKASSALRRHCLAAAFLSCAALAPGPAQAVLDNRDRGPSLTAGKYALRVTNAGIIGNAFLDIGLSFDPSFEFPIASGREALNYAALWVGALGENGVPHVSGGPLLEFRPTLDPDDRVFVADRRRLGVQRLKDDDGDGRADEEFLNGRDDDGDGETDEDLGFFSEQVASADYTDDQPEAIRFTYPNGEIHQALGISVHQEAYTWAVPGFDGIAGLKFTIRNHGTRTLRQLYLGLYADLDSRARDDLDGHVDDRVTSVGYSRSVFEGVSFTTVGGIYPRNCVPGGGCAPFVCVTRLAQTVPVVVDGTEGSGLPAVAVLPLDHTTDPLARLGVPQAQAAARAPASVSFRSAVFANGRVPGHGGPPILDRERYAAMQGTLAGADLEFPADYAVLVSCGPFASLEPGQSLEFAAALVAAEVVDSLEVALGNAAILYHGDKVSLLPDSTGVNAGEYFVGETGLNGHDVCLEPPGNVRFQMDPHCLAKYVEPGDAPPVAESLYVRGHCIWTDSDCNECTGLNGKETVERWLDPGMLPPRPGMRLGPLDHGVRIEWDNTPEILFNAGLALLPQQREQSRFLGYRVWKLADWRDRSSLVPDRSHWALFGNYGPDDGQTPLSTVTDENLDYLRILYEQKQYPVGRYRVVDPEVQNGFDYLYVVTAVLEYAERLPSGPVLKRKLESPIYADFAQRVRPQAAAQPGAGGVWVVPNPYRGWADWNLTRVLGDPLTRHIDFMGLPRALCTIKIWTVAGDFVAQIDHDGRAGDGQAEWNLVSRNGQEVVSGIYLFTVDSDLGRQVGRFVVVR